MFFLLNTWVFLLGLSALLIPIIIHLLNRRRYDVVDWGAMQFLQLSETTRRRLLIEELLLMALRIGLLAVLVLAIAGPIFSSPALSRLGRPSRDVVLVIDGSASMLAHGEGEQAPAELAKTFALELIDDLSAGDGVAVLLAREQPVALVGDLTIDHDRARRRLKELPEPGGSSNWPEAIRTAGSLLTKSQKGNREIILLSDNQKFGWADADTLFRWELLTGELKAKDGIAPQVWSVNLAAARAARLPNWALGAIQSNRPVVPIDREVKFDSEIFLYGQKGYRPPHRLRLEVDGKHVRDLPPPGGKGTNLSLPKDGRVPFSFTHRFATPGSHLVSLILEPDPPEQERQHGHEVKDRVPGDNRQDFAVEVLPALPVLIVDGESSAAPQQFRGTDFLRDALSPARDPNPVVKAAVVGPRDFTPALLSADPRPRVLILHDVGRLEPGQVDAIGGFLGEGGGVLVTLGGRVESDWYNERLHRDGEGWLPARLEALDGDEKKPNEAMRPDPPTFTHPALELFRGIPVGGLNEARFYRWWKVTLPGKSAPGVVAGTMRNPTTRTPFVVERTFAAGRVLLCAVPLDNSWGTNLTDLVSFVPLAHELVYYLAGARSADFNLKAGQPIRYRTPGDPRLERFSLTPPYGETKPLSNLPGASEAHQAQLVRRERESLVIYEGTRQAGVYRLTTPEGQTIHYVVPTDGRESDLTPCNEQERERVAKLTGMKYAADRQELIAGFSEGSDRWERAWWFLLVGLLGLLCMEVWMTRRVVRGR